MTITDVQPGSAMTIASLKMMIKKQNSLVQNVVTEVALANQEKEVNFQTLLKEVLYWSYWSQETILGPMRSSLYVAVVYAWFSKH